MDFLIDGRRIGLFRDSRIMTGGLLSDRRIQEKSNVTFFMILKTSGHDLSNEESNFILSLIEVGHLQSQ